MNLIISKLSHINKVMVFIWHIVNLLRHFIYTTYPEAYYIFVWVYRFRYIFIYPLHTSAFLYRCMLWVYIYNINSNHHPHNIIRYLHILLWKLQGIQVTQDTYLNLLYLCITTNMLFYHIIYNIVETEEQPYNNKKQEPYTFNVNNKCWNCWWLMRQSSETTYICSYTTWNVVLY